MRHLWYEPVSRAYASACRMFSDADAGKEGGGGGKKAGYNALSDRECDSPNTGLR